MSGRCLKLLSGRKSGVVKIIITCPIGDTSILCAENIKDRLTNRFVSISIDI